MSSENKNYIIEYEHRDIPGVLERKMHCKSVVDALYLVRKFYGQEIDFISVTFETGEVWDLEDR